MLGSAPETTVAEKGVTILERGTSSTRWRDYVDIVQLAVAGIDDQVLLESMRAVARYRSVTLGHRPGGRGVRRHRSGKVGCMASQGSPRGRHRFAPR